MTALIVPDRVRAEHVTYQMTHMSYREMSKHLAGYVVIISLYTIVGLTFAWIYALLNSSPISFLKMTCTQMAQETAKDAVQIYGGRGEIFFS